MTLAASRGLWLYLNTLQQALADSRITDDEMAILDILARCLGLEENSLGEAWAILRGEIPSPISAEQEDNWSSRHMGDATCYQSALIAALDDEIISEDEMAMLDSLRSVMGLQADEHAMVEEAIRAMISEREDDHLLERLEGYITKHPFQ